MALPTPSAAVAASARASAAVGGGGALAAAAAGSFATSRRPPPPPPPPPPPALQQPPPPVVGYSIPFEEVAAEGVTRLTFCDFASLLSEMGDDPLLSARSAVVVGGAGARALAGDLVLSLLRRVLRRRPELRVVVTCSDVGAAESVARFFGWRGGKGRERRRGEEEAATAAAAAAAKGLPPPPAPPPPPSPSPVPAVLQLPRSLHPVRVQYLAEPAPNYLEAAAEAIAETLRRSDGGGGGEGGRATPSSSSGDILLFVPGASEAVEAAEAILEAARRANEDSEEEEGEEGEGDEDDYLDDARGGKKRGRGGHQQRRQQQPRRGRQQPRPLPSVLRLHAGAPASHASAALSPPPRASSSSSSRSSLSSSARRVLVATDEGVAGLSLPAVGVVVDSLLQRRTKSGGGGDASSSSSLSSSNFRVEETVPVSALLAASRASRAGVARPGLCLRLSTRGDFEEAVARRGSGRPGSDSMASASTSTGYSFDLTSACLRLKAFGVDNLRSHEWGPSFLERAAWKEAEAEEQRRGRRKGSGRGSAAAAAGRLRPLYSSPLPPARPPAAALARALEALCSLGALDEASGRLTQRGRLLAELPTTLDPRWGTSLLSAALDSDDPAPPPSAGGGGGGGSDDDGKRGGRRKTSVVGPRAAADVATIAAFASLRPPWLPPFAVKAALEREQEEHDGGGESDESGGDDEEERRRKLQLGGAALSAELRLGFAAAEGDPITVLNVWAAWSRVGSRARGPRASSRWCARHGLDLRVLLRAGDVRQQLLRHLARLGVATAASDAAADGGGGDNGARSGSGGGSSSSSSSSSVVSAVVRALARGFFASAAISIGPAPPEPGVGGGIAGGGGGGAGVGVGAGGRRAAQTATGDNGGWPAFELLSSSSSSTSSSSGSPTKQPLLRICPPSVLSASFAGALGLELPTPKAILFFDASVGDGGGGFGGGGGGGRGKQQQQRPRRDRPVAEVRSALAIDPGLLLEVAPHFYEARKREWR